MKNKKTPKPGATYNPQDYAKHQHIDSYRDELDKWERRERERSDMIKIVLVMAMSWFVVLGTCAIYLTFFR